MSGFGNVSRISGGTVGGSAVPIGETLQPSAPALPKPPVQIATIGPDLFEDGAQLTTGWRMDNPMIGLTDREIVGSFGKPSAQVSTFDAPPPPGNGSKAPTRPSAEKTTESKDPKSPANMVELMKQMKLMNQLQQSYEEMLRLKTAIEAKGGPNAVPKTIAAKIADLPKPKSMEEQLKLVNQIRQSLRDHLSLQQAIDEASRKNTQIIRNFQ